MMITEKEKQAQGRKVVNVSTLKWMRFTKSLKEGETAVFAGFSVTKKGSEFVIENDPTPYPKSNALRIIDMMLDK